jgi:1-acyl-sn-glycerol-3-phosphate acyltransferase
LIQGQYQNYIGAKIFYPGYTQDVKRAVLKNKRMDDLIEQVATSRFRQMLHDFETRKIPKMIPMEAFLQQTRKEVYHVLMNMMTDMSSTRTLKFVAFVVTNILMRMYHQGIHIKESEFLEVKKVAQLAQDEKVSLIFLPNHKSHIDYLVISYIFYRLGIALPHIAAGDNINIPFIGRLLKNTGAFFIRRQWGNDPIYNGVMKEYIETLLSRGHNIEAFIEGTRSRIGKLLKPKYGILKIILQAVLNQRVKDCYIVPMSIGYDKVIETSTYVNELLGTPKEKESLLQLFSNLNILNLKWGKIDVRFAKPFSLKQFIQSQSLRQGPDWTPTHSEKNLNVLLQSLSYRILSSINAVSVIMPTAIVGTILLTLRGNGVGEAEVSFLRLFESHFKDDSKG